MKKFIALLLSFLLCILLCSCTPLSPSNTISYNDIHTEMYYNGNTYTNYNNTNGKYQFAIKDEDWQKIATMPYGFFYILGAVTIYYGNHVDNPDFIINSRTIDFYVREDLIFDHNTEVSVCDTEDTYCFKISDVITENVIKYDFEQKGQFTELCNFFVSFNQHPYVKLWITISKRNDILYLQDAWNSNYYAITPEFEQEIYRLGLDSFDYHIK